MTLQEVASASAMIKTELAPVFEKIGQGAEWTFEIFVRQAYVNAFRSLLFIIPGIICLAFSKYFWTKIHTKYDSDAQFFGSIAMVLLLTIGLLMILGPISNVIQVAINPEYAAIKLIIETVQGTK